MAQFSSLVDWVKDKGITCPGTRRAASGDKRAAGQVAVTVSRGSSPSRLAYRRESRFHSKA